MADSEQAIKLKPELTKWGKLTDDDLTAINGKREQLEGKLQRRSS